MIKRIMGYGLLIHIILNMLLFVLSLILSFTSDSNKGLGEIVVAVLAVLMFLIVGWFIKKMKPATAKEAYRYSIGWTIVTIVLFLIVTIGNDTAGAVFGNWALCLVFIAMALAPLTTAVSRQNQPVSSL